MCTVYCVLGQSKLLLHNLSENNLYRRMKCSLIIIKLLTLVIFVTSRRLKGASKIIEESDVSTRTRHKRTLAGKGTGSGTGTGKGKGTGSGTGTGKGKGTGSGTGKGKGNSGDSTNCNDGKGKGKGGSRDTHSIPCNSTVLISNDANWYESPTP